MFIYKKWETFSLFYLFFSVDKNIPLTITKYIFPNYESILYIIGNSCILVFNQILSSIALQKMRKHECKKLKKMFQANLETKLNVYKVQTTELRKNNRNL